MFKLRAAIAALGLFVAASATGYFFAANVQANYVTAGTTRYAMVAAQDAQTSTSTSFVSIPGLSTTVTVPSGKVADLIIDFSGEVNSCSAMSVRAVVDSTASSPTSAQIFWPTGGGAQAEAFTFFAKAVKSGTHTVAIQWSEITACSQMFISSRTMVITSNVH